MATVAHRECSTVTSERLGTMVPRVPWYHGSRGGWYGTHTTPGSNILGSVRRKAPHVSSMHEQQHNIYITRGLTVHGKFILLFLGPLPKKRRMNVSAPDTRG